MCWSFLEVSNSIDWSYIVLWCTRVRQSCLLPTHHTHGPIILISIVGTVHHRTRNVSYRRYLTIGNVDTAPTLASLRTMLCVYTWYVRQRWCQCYPVKYTIIASVCTLLNKGLTLFSHELHCHFSGLHTELAINALLLSSNGMRGKCQVTCYLALM